MDKRSILTVPYSAAIRDEYCSEASTQMLLGFYGVWLSQDEIHNAGYDRFEVLEPLLRRFLYLSSRPNADPGTIHRVIDSGNPIIVRYRTDDSLHTIIVIGYTNSDVIIHDPNPKVGAFAIMDMNELYSRSTGAYYATDVRKKDEYETFMKNVIRLSNPGDGWIPPPEGVSPMFDNWVKSMAEGLEMDEQIVRESEPAYKYARKLGIA